MSGQSIKIRNARPEDAVAIRDLHVNSILRLAHESYAKEVVTAWSGKKEPHKYIEAMNSGEKMIVAEDASTIIGFGSVIPAQQEVRAVYVHPDHIRKGVGKKLLNELEKIAISEGIREVKLNSSLNAIDFYIACGFSRGNNFEHTLHDGTKITCVKMSKVLANN